MQAAGLRNESQIENMLSQCPTTATVMWTTFYPENETFVYHGSDSTPFVKQAWQLYNQNRLGDGYYSFRLQAAKPSAKWRSTRASKQAVAC